MHALAAIADARATRRDAAAGAISRQIRGSNLLLAGRVVSLALGLATQIAIVRYLSQTSFGAFAYALSVVAVGQTIATFGLDRAIGRFVPIYQERGDYSRLFGTIAMVAGTIVVLGAGVIGGVAVLQAALPSVLTEPEIGSLLLILVALAPLQALDTVLVGLFAVLARPRSIFVRTYVLAPGLRLVVVLVAALAGAGVLFLAAGYVVAAAVGSGIYAVVLYRLLRSEGLLERFRLDSIRFPAREVFALTVPLLTTDLVVVLISASDTVLLGYFKGTADVASFAAVKPIAELNHLALLSFTLLFVPLAARLFARDDRAGINELYWQTAAWVAAISFPVFAVTFLFAEPVVGLLYGSRYEESALFLAVLAVGFYVQASLGLNGTTLMVFGRIRYIVGLNGLTILFNLALNLTLIPVYGALGAAIGTSVTLALHNLLKQLALARATSVQFFSRRYAKLYAAIGAGAAVLVAANALDAPFVARLAVVVGACLVCFAAARRLLDIAETFPELRRIPFLGAGRAAP
jgi:O-antigen/teichoic acid export membrane protein